ncbi:MAG: serine hydrolase [Myxococcota bacterium]
MLECDWAAGMSIALVYPDREEHYHYGVKEVGKPEVPNSETLYEIGSVTKVFMSLLLARAVVEGRLACGLRYLGGLLHLQPEL